MKKLSLYIFLGLLWCNVGFAEKISLECKFPTGAKFGGSFDIDTVKKKLTNILLKKVQQIKLLNLHHLIKFKGQFGMHIFLR